MKQSLRSAVILAFLALLPALGSAFYFHDRVSWQHPPAADEVEVATAKDWNALWLDARPSADFAQDHVPGALSLNAEDWDQLLPVVLRAWTPGRKLVVYCSAQTCDASREVARRLREEAQLKDVYVLTGGWEAWKKANGR